MGAGRFRVLALERPFELLRERNGRKAHRLTSITRAARIDCRTCRLVARFEHVPAQGEHHGYAKVGARHSD